MYFATRKAEVIKVRRCLWYQWLWTWFPTYVWHIGVECSQILLSWTLGEQKGMSWLLKCPHLIGWIPAMANVWGISPPLLELFSGVSEIYYNHSQFKINSLLCRQTCLIIVSDFCTEVVLCLGNSPGLCSHLYRNCWADTCNSNSTGSAMPK